MSRRSSQFAKVSCLSALVASLFVLFVINFTPALAELPIVSLATGQKDPVGIVTDETYVYWAEWEEAE